MVEKHFGTYTASLDIMWGQGCIELCLFKLPGSEGVRLMLLESGEQESQRAEPGPLADVSPIRTVINGSCEGFKRLHREGWVGRRGTEARRPGNHKKKRSSDAWKWLEE